jgi:protein-disulfide isomerase
MKKQVIFGASALALLLIFVIAALYYRGHQAEKIAYIAREQGSVFIRDHSPIAGDPEAKVTIVEFMDPACETCAAFSPFVKQMMNANPGKINLVLRYAPFHDGADYFVKILEAAGKQGKYWETLDIMYKSQQFWASHHNPQPEKIWQFLPRAGLDIEQIKKDMNDPEIDRIITQDLADAETMGVQKTPGFFVNGRPLQTFGYEQLTQLVRSEYIAQYSN